MGISGDTTLDCHEEEKMGFDGRLHNIEVYFLPHIFSLEGILL